MLLFSSFIKKTKTESFRDLTAKPILKCPMQPRKSIELRETGFFYFLAITSKSSVEKAIFEVTKLLAAALRIL